MKTITKTLPTGVVVTHNQEGKIHVYSGKLSVVTGNPFTIDTIIGINIFKDGQNR